VRKFLGVVFALVGALLLIWGAVSLVLVAIALFHMGSATAYSSGFVAGKAIAAVLFTLLGLATLKGARRRLSNSAGSSPPA
jgi:hypothetical protein